MGAVYRGQDRTLVADVDEAGVVTQPNTNKVLLRASHGQTFLRRNSPNVIGRWKNANGQINVYSGLTTKLLGWLVVAEDGRQATVHSAANSNEPVGEVEAETFAGLLAGAATLLIPNVL